VHAKVQHCIGRVVMLQPLVEGGILGVRGQITLKEQAHGIALHSQCWLYPYPHVAQLQPTYHEVPCTPQGKTILAKKLILAS
jgi:hypothetical protein